MFKFDLDVLVNKIETIAAERGKRIPTDELVILLSKEGFVFATDEEGDLSVDKSVVILKGLISLTTNLNCSAGRTGGIGLTSWEKGANKPVSELTQLRRDIEAFGLDSADAKVMVSKYMKDLLGRKTDVLNPKDIVAKYL